MEPLTEPGRDGERHGMSFAPAGVRAERVCRGTRQLDAADVKVLEGFPADKCSKANSWCPPSASSPLAAPDLAPSLRSS
jgi:hypothetical protein